MAETYDEVRLARLVPYPAPDANKYTRGKLELVAGSPAYPGAAVLAARAAQRAGAGYTEVFASKEALPYVRQAQASLVVRPWSALSFEGERPADARHPHAVAVGSGFDAEGSAEEGVLRTVLAGTHAPVLVDGGALAFLAREKMRRACVERYRAGLVTVLTPHGGEAARLAAPLRIPANDPERLAADLARAYGAVVVLKGPDTFVSEGVRTFRMGEGTPALAKAGTGDVLAGVIGALLAQGVRAVDACMLGTTVHARAGKAAAQAHGAISVIAEDVVDALPAAFGTFA